ncbi:MAG: hypothetical protein LBG74_04580 [Spirochaetaceae bacterium]|jgi:hypothetical protein|nr:hypothetical protein [Spirochaetaceae bacterium]
MSKAHRGKGIWELAARGRGICPVCKRENVKILYEQETDGQKVKICKTCKAALAHGKKGLNVTAGAAAGKTETPATPKTEAPVAQPPAETQPETAASAPEAGAPENTAAPDAAGV